MLWGHGQPGVTWDTPKAGRVCVVSTTHGSSFFFMFLLSYIDLCGFLIYIFS